jgi:hypothetical protein
LGGPESLALLEQEWPVEARGAALAGAARGVMPYDLTRARAHIEELKKLESDPAYKKSMAEVPDRQRESRKSSSVEFNLRDMQAALDPVGALRAIEEGRGEGHEDHVRLKVARAAWRRGDDALLERALRPYADREPLYGGSTAQLAVLAERFNKELAARLWSKAEEGVKRAEAQNARNSGSRDNSMVASYAFYRAPLEPELSRLRLETIWSHAHLTYGDDAAQNYDSSHEKLILAMMPLDPVRALEMLNQITGLSVPHARLRVAVYLLSDEKGRMNFGGN